MDVLTEKAIINDLNQAHGLKQLTFITIISLAFNGLLAESKKQHKDSYEREVDLQIPASIDSSCLYKDFFLIWWYSNKEEKTTNEFVSMIEITSRITNITSAILLLFQIVFF